MENKEREAFESVFTAKKGWDLTCINGCYQNIGTFKAFTGWQAAKEHATPEGFVLVPKDELTTTYYWEGAEHTVNCVSEYEMELEKGEIAELEKWDQTKSTKAFFANIYSDEDNFEIVEFDSIEAAQQAIKENKAMIEAQEQSHD